MRADLLATLQAAAAETQTFRGERVNYNGIAYILTIRQMTDLEAADGGYDLTEHGRQDRQLLMCVGTRAQFDGQIFASWPGSKAYRPATSQTLTWRAVDDTSDPLHIRLVAIARRAG